MFVDNLKGRLFFKIYNVGNLLSDSGGKQWDARFFSQRVVDMSLAPGGEYSFDGFNDQDFNRLREFRTLWEIKLGVELNFN